MSAYSSYDRAILDRLTKHTLPSLITVRPRTSSGNREKRYSPYSASRRKASTSSPLFEDGNQLNTNIGISSVSTFSYPNESGRMPHNVAQVLIDMRELTISEVPCQYAATTKMQHTKKALELRKQQKIKAVTPRRHHPLSPRSNTPPLTSDDDSSCSSSRESSPGIADAAFSSPRISGGCQLDIEHKMQYLSLVPSYPSEGNGFNPYSLSVAFPGDAHLFMDS